MSKPTHKSTKLTVGGFSRVSQLVPHYLPFSISTFWRLVKAKQFPSPVKLTGRITAWANDDVQNWLDTKAGQSVTRTAGAKD